MDIDCGCCVTAGIGATASKASNGFIDCVAAGAVFVRVMLMPLTGFSGGGGAVFPVIPGFCSPSLISASTARSRLPFSPFKTVAFRFSSGNPISLRVANFESRPSPD